MSERYLVDCAEIYENSQFDGNPLIYEFNNIFPEATEAELLYGLTTIYPGTINGEYYMTKGHIHAQNTAELYYGVEGAGLVLQEKDDDCVITNIAPGVMIYVKPGYAHRLINNSDEILRVVCAARADSGHDYSVKFSQRFKKGEKLI